MTQLTAERWKQIEAIFAEAAQQAEPARSDAVKRLCGEDSELCDEVQKILASYTVLYDSEFAKNSTRGALTGSRIGHYRLDRLLGQGGMSSVYLAHRDDGQFEQTVAIKLMSPHLADEFFSDRFRRERQILADLNHPNITRLLDGGVTDRGDPYLVMEYVDGRPLDKYCDERHLSIQQRIELLLEICSAIQHTHDRQILHRDLKPSNILVTNDGVPKLLDFGTAKTLGSPNAESTTTRFGMMTLRYASPEQLRGEAPSVATDIYSLGVVLYESLTGAWPFGDYQSVIAGLDRAVHDVKPARMPKAITEKAAAHRATTAAELANSLNGSLEAVAAKALESRPEDRYRSMDELAGDLLRYLNGKPVVGGARRQRLRSWSVRAAAAAAIVAVLCLASVYAYRRVATSSLLARSIVVLPFVNATADSANQYFSDGLTDEITDSLARFKTFRVIARSSAFQFKGKTVDIREVGRLLHVANVLEGSFERSGDRVRVIAHLQRVSDGSQVWSNTYERRISDLFAVQSEIAAGIAGSLKADAGVPPKNHIPKPEAHELAIKARYDMQQMTNDSLARAEKEYQQAIDLDPEYAAAYLGLASASYDRFVARGSAYQTEGEWRRAEQLFRKALTLDSDLSSAHAMLAALAMQYDWDWAGAEREFRLAVAGPPSSAAESFYAFFLVFRSRIAEADQHLLRLQEVDPFSTATMNNLPVARNLEGRFAEARENAERMSAQYPKIFEPQLMIGMSYIGEGRPRLALPIFKQLKQRFPQAPLFEAMARARAGQREEALRLIRPFEEQYRTSRASMSWFALVYALLGDEPNTVKWLARSADLHEWQALNIAVNPVYAPMRSSPGFQALEKRMGLQ